MLLLINVLDDDDDSLHPLQQALHRVQSSMQRIGSTLDFWRESANSTVGICPTPSSARMRNAAPVSPALLDVGNLFEEIESMGRGHHRALESRVPGTFKDACTFAIRLAATETGLPRSTFPERCPWTFGQVTAPDFWPEPV